MGCVAGFVASGSLAQMSNPCAIGCRCSSDTCTHSPSWSVPQDAGEDGCVLSCNVMLGNESPLLRLALSLLSKRPPSSIVRATQEVYS